MADQPKTILIVDDDPDLLESNELLLQARGYRVLTAYDGPAGLAIAREEHPDLIIMDVMMGTDTEGIDTSRQIRREPGLEETPILLMTGIRSLHGRDIDLTPDAERLPVNDVIEKPVSPSILMAKVRELLS
ncbi:MAG: putative transcriptional regulatory protein TcrX [Lentisphaerae bacterium ADurb.BinA184]|nr:MAG: putative transcriptional regulatory protein TcrX [Lentisphaerae bacterium ADurb.BinA184]